MNLKGHEKLRGMVMVVSLVALAGCSLQERMLYYPGPEIPNPEEMAAGGIEFWPKGGSDYLGFIFAAGKTDATCTVVVLHGNAGTAADRTFYGDMLLPLGCRVILAEYPGYGRRPGKLSEESFVADARRILALAADLYPGPIYLLGESLGAGVAASAAKDHLPRIDGLVLITPWDSLQAVAKTKFPFLPVKLLLRDKYDSTENLINFPRGVAVVAALRDEIIPLKHAVSLYASLRGHKKMWQIKGAGHNDWPLVVDKNLWREVFLFLKEH